MEPVNTNSRKVGDSITVYNMFGRTPRVKHAGTIIAISTKYITVESPGRRTRFNRATGFMVGYARTQ